jgi:hypothetical protein
MKNESFNEVGTFSLHVKVQVCFESEASLGCAAVAHGKEGSLSHFYPFYPCGKKIVAQFGVTVCRKSLKNEPLGKIDMKILKVAVALGLATSLSGCLSDSDGVNLIASANSLLERQADATKITDSPDLSGTAMMTGFVSAGITSNQVAIDERQVFAGYMSLVADFESGDLTGATSNLGLYKLTEDETCAQAICDGEKLSDLDGDLALTGTINGATFSGLMSGAVEGQYSDEDFSGEYTAGIELSVYNGAFFEDADGLLATADLKGGVGYTLADDESGQEISGSETLNGGMIVEGDMVDVTN